MKAVIRVNPVEAVAVADSMPITALLERFILSQDVKPSSRALYRRAIGQFFNWIQSKGLALAELDRTHVLAYKDDLLSRGISPLTVNSYLSAVRIFYEFVEANKLYPNIARGVRGAKRKNRFKRQALTADASTELLQYFESQALRDFALVNLMLRTGLRTVEVSRANVEDITYRGGRRILNVQGKGRDSKDSFVILTDKAYKPIADYLATRGRVLAGEPLFTSTSNNNRGERLTTRTISGVVKDGLRAIGIDAREYTAHSLRHTAGTMILRAGGRIEDAQGVLRHASPVTTQIYVETIAEEQRLKNAPELLIDALI